tara:strand:- start:52117 stop:52914 length:798 start_codon:yes stop_codon:yes gene_type:complete
MGIIDRTSNGVYDYYVMDPADGGRFGRLAGFRAQIDRKRLCVFSENENYPYGESRIALPAHPVSGSAVPSSWTRQREIHLGLRDSFTEPSLDTRGWGVLTDWASGDPGCTARLRWPSFTLGLDPCDWSPRSSDNLVLLVDLVVNLSAEKLFGGGSFPATPLNERVFSCDDRRRKLVDAIKKSLMKELLSVYEHYAYCIDKYKLRDAGITKMYASYVSDEAWEVLKRDFPILFYKGLRGDFSINPIASIEKSRAKVARGATIAWAI